jgi:hypothetical protein
MTAPMTRAEILAMPPTISLPDLGRALGVSEPVIREQARREELQRIGIKVVRLGAQYRVVTASLWTFLGIAPDGGTDSASSEARPRRAARQGEATASVVRLACADVRRGCLRTP